MPKLFEEPISRNARLQQSAKPGSKDYIRKGHEGPHVRVLQKTLNIIRTAGWGYYNPRNKYVRPIWPYLSLNGQFDSSMKRVVERYQVWGNHMDRWTSHKWASVDGPVGSRAYKKSYHKARIRLARDGIVGPKTLQSLDLLLMFIKIWDEAETKRRSR